MREFVIINANGEEMDMNQKNHFLHSVKGMGVEKNNTYEQIGNDFYKITEVTRQKKIQGKVFFDSYESFNEFARFIQNSPLTVRYSADNIGAYYIDVEIQKLDKAEKEATGLNCGIELNNIGAYYRLIDVVNEQSEDVQGKTYPFRYEYTYTDFGYGEAVIDSDSEQEGKCELTIVGPAKNPSWTHTVNSELVTTGKVNIELAAGEKLVIDDTKIPYSIKRKDMMNHIISNEYQNSDFTTERFISLKKGVNRIRIVHEGTGELKIRVRGRVAYDAV